MSKKNYDLMLFLICLWGIVSIAGIWAKAQNSQSYKNDRFDECLQAVNEAIPDPNEIQERSDFLRNCYE